MTDAPDPRASSAAEKLAALEAAARVLAETRSVLVIDWPSRDVPVSLAFAGFTVFVKGGPGPSDYAAWQLDGGEPVSRPLGREPDRVDLVYCHRPFGELAGRTAGRPGALVADRADQQRRQGRVGLLGATGGITSGSRAGGRRGARLRRRCLHRRRRPCPRRAPGPVRLTRHRVDRRAADRVHRSGRHGAHAGTGQVMPLLSPRQDEGVRCSCSQCRVSDVSLQRKVVAAGAGSGAAG